MNLADERWTTWSKVRFPSRRGDYANAIHRTSALTGVPLAYGTDEEPGSSLWLASLSAAMEAHFRQGVTIFDYGCGAGRYADFIRQRLHRFGYFGVEKPHSRTGH